MPLYGNICGNYRNSCPGINVLWEDSDENGVEKNTSKLVIFLPGFCHFEHERKKQLSLPTVSVLDVVRQSWQK